MIVGIKPLSVQFDVSKSQSVQEVIDFITNRFGHLDIVLITHKFRPHKSLW
ncbi:MAG: hypothetical protein K2P17_07020 [Helicobacteraceae bacterium]|nr:hypothetical protein [Helicobacteraceae bacterium]